MSDEQSLKKTVETLFQGVENVIQSKTVVGEAIHIGDTIILPLVDISFGMGAGYSSADRKDRGTGGVGGKITPSSVIVIKNGVTKLVNIKNQDTMTKILDLVPDVIDKFTSGKESRVTEADVMDILENDDTGTDSSQL
jgi:uncharacterized spore protein YtfJ